ncbi:MAG: hypothetical protein NDI88_07235, partial [Lysobacter sp.]|nr:hypothetical protein [Lysobacter sp.]
MRKILAAIVFLSLPALAQQVDREQIERRLGAVETLIERSSAAKQIEASGDARARAHRDRAREIHGRAAMALRDGDLAA